MRKSEALKNVRLFKWFVIFSEPLFWEPILISYIIDIGKIDLPNIYFMESIILLGTIFLEIPSGALADLIGRKKTLIAGNFFHLVSIIIFSFSISPTDIWIANITCMIGYSFHSGTDKALLYDSLKEIYKESEYTKIIGGNLANRLIVIAFGCLISGWLFKIEPRFPFFLSIPGVLFTTILTFYFKEPTKTRKYNVKEQLETMKTGLQIVIKNKNILWIMFFTLLIGVASKIWFFTYNPYFELVELKTEYYGIMFFLLNMVAWYFSRNAHIFTQKNSVQKCATIMVLLIGFPILIMGIFVSKLSLTAILLQNVVRGLLSPFSSNLLNKQIGSLNRATIISIQSALGGLAQFCSLSIFGYLLKICSLTFCLQILGVSVLIFGSLIIFIYPKIFNNSTIK